MAITLELSPELEEQLRGAALAKGLTVEGYLLTLVEAIAQPTEMSHGRRSAFTRTLDRLFRRRKHSQVEAHANPDKVVRETIREMRESVLKYKEQAVDAVTTANMLRRAVDLQEREIAAKELQALHRYSERHEEEDMEG